VSETSIIRNTISPSYICSSERRDLRCFAQIGREREILRQ